MWTRRRSSKLHQKRDNKKKSPADSSLSDGRSGDARARSGADATVVGGLDSWSLAATEPPRGYDTQTGFNSFCREQENQQWANKRDEGTPTQSPSDFSRESYKLRLMLCTKLVPETKVCKKSTFAHL